MKEIFESRINLLRSQLADIDQRREYIQAQLRLLEDIAELIEKYPALGEGLVGLLRQSTMPRRRRTRELVSNITEVLQTAPQGMELEEIRRALVDRGVQLPGKDPQVQRARLTLIFRKNHDLFQRVRRGVYRLKV